MTKKQYIDLKTVIFKNIQYTVYYTVYVINFQFILKKVKRMNWKRQKLSRS